MLTTDFVKEPVTVASVELLVNGKNYLLRTRSTAGVEAITVPNPERLAQIYPIFLKTIVPVFLKQDARKLESLLWDVYRHNSNYKLQGIALLAILVGGVAGIARLVKRGGRTGQPVPPLGPEEKRDYYSVQRDIPPSPG